MTISWHLIALDGFGYLLWNSDCLFRLSVCLIRREQVQLLLKAVIYSKFPAENSIALPTQAFIIPFAYGYQVGKRREKN